jgi:hypothetical protein
MAVISLSTDKSTLEAQLSGLRQQKQQMEQMLLFGSGGLCWWGGGVWGVICTFLKVAVFSLWCTQQSSCLHPVPC